MRPNETKISGENTLMFLAPNGVRVIATPKMTVLDEDGSAEHGYAYIVFVPSAAMDEVGARILDGKLEESANIQTAARLMVDAAALFVPTSTPRGGD